MKNENGKISIGGIFIGFAFVILIAICLYLVALVNDLMTQNTQYATNEMNAEQTEKVKIETEIDLTDDELEVITEYLNEKDNNRFLTSYYDEIEEIDLYSVLLDGNGLSDESSSTIAREYEAITGEEPITDVNKYTSKKLKEFLNEKTGIEFDLEKTNLASKAKYSEKYDAYYIQAGDTNYSPVVCTSGCKKENKYVINGKYCDEAAMEGEFTVTLEKDGDNYLFVSNVKNAEEIEEMNLSENQENEIEKTEKNKNIESLDKKNDANNSETEENAYDIFANNYKENYKNVFKKTQNYEEKIMSTLITNSEETGVDIIYIDGNNDVYIGFSSTNKADLKVSSDVANIYIADIGNGGYQDAILIKLDGTVEILSTDDLKNKDYNPEKRNDLKNIVSVIRYVCTDLDEDGNELGGGWNYKFIDINGNIFE